MPSLGGSLANDVFAAYAIMAVMAVSALACLFAALFYRRRYLSVLDASENPRNLVEEQIAVPRSSGVDKTGVPVACEGAEDEISEVTRRVQLEHRFQKLTDQVPGGLFQMVRHTDGSFTAPYLSPGFRKLTGIPDGAPNLDPDMALTQVVEEDREGYVMSLKESGLRLVPWDHEFRFRPGGGDMENWFHVIAMPDKAADGTITWHGYVSDISVRKRHEMEIEKLAYFDTLTLLPNRRQFLDRMSHAVAACAKAGQFGALLYIDLDNFKVLNDTQGHHVGDAFLVHVSARLRICIRPEDVVARIGGDEFVVILEPTGRDSANIVHRATKVANRILEALREGFDLAGTRHVSTASIGVAIFDGTDVSVDDILKRADLAMYQAKTLGRNKLALFDPVAMQHESERYRLLADLRQALHNGELDFHYQPQVDHSGRICAAEGLIRWSHPTMGVLMPDRFVPLAEHFGLNQELSRFTIERGLAVLASWRDDPVMKSIRLAVNIGAQSFAANDFVATVKELVDRYEIDAGLLTLELTEHVMAKEPDRVSGQMHELKQLGVRLSLDDFGTGYSSLAYLKQMPFDEVKIDGSFVEDIETRENDRTLVKTILAMARLLGLEAVAEHVENVRQEAFLRAFGCDYLQGFLYSPAVPLSRFVALCHDADKSKPIPMIGGRL
ncbi:putative bifunctional diguanylate cyclase/phosphodiesterase [Oryzicola mucosus]|uniref:EAL domain-containing protein n=1 Tax=Oryzicola mucosus TaxID=2767425 RepID=A0A8J6TZ62_9HYPH|nr:EAL domain-containing protein [Oryzicola mucosus]MBD0415764.1 EAL domain-containing protein [Oryzicola mucosus]